MRRPYGNHFPLFPSSEMDFLKVGHINDTFVYMIGTLSSPQLLLSCISCFPWCLLLGKLLWRSLNQSSSPTIPLSLDHSIESKEGRSCVVFLCCMAQISICGLTFSQIVHLHRHNKSGRKVLDPSQYVVNLSAIFMA